MNWIKNSSLLILLVCTLFSCKQNYTPKPHGYFRIDFPDKEYQLCDSIYQFSFEYPVYGKLEPVAHSTYNSSLLNLQFPKYKGTIHLTYIKINNNLDQLIETEWKMVYSKIAQKADHVDDYVVEIPKRNVYGMIYDIKGNAASSALFFVTDSVTNFLRGSLYFYAKPNQDSLAPAIAFFREDIIHLVESIKWKDDK